MAPRLAADPAGLQGLTDELREDPAGLQALTEELREEIMIVMLDTVQSTASMVASVCLQRLETMRERIIREFEERERKLRPPPAAHSRGSGLAEAPLAIAAAPAKDHLQSFYFKAAAASAAAAPGTLRDAGGAEGEEEEEGPPPEAERRRSAAGRRSRFSCLMRQHEAARPPTDAAEAEAAAGARLEPFAAQEASASCLVDARRSVDVERQDLVMMRQTSSDNGAGEAKREDFLMSDDEPVSSSGEDFVANCFDSFEVTARERAARERLEQRLREADATGGVQLSEEEDDEDEDTQLLQQRLQQEQEQQEQALVVFKTCSNSTCRKLSSRGRLDTIYGDWYCWDCWET